MVGLRIAMTTGRDREDEKGYIKTRYKTEI
jgi:hypothetical protein